MKSTYLVHILYKFIILLGKFCKITVFTQECLADTDAIEFQKIKAFRDEMTKLYEKNNTLAAECAALQNQVPAECPVAGLEAAPDEGSLQEKVLADCAGIPVRYAKLAELIYNSSKVLTQAQKDADQKKHEDRAIQDSEIQKRTNNIKSLSTKVSQDEFRDEFDELFPIQVFPQGMLSAKTTKEERWARFKAMNPTEYQDIKKNAIQRQAEKKLLRLEELKYTSTKFYEDTQTGLSALNNDPDPNKRTQLLGTFTRHDGQTPSGAVVYNPTTNTVEIVFTGTYDQGRDWTGANLDIHSAGDCHGKKFLEGAQTTRGFANVYCDGLKSFEDQLGHILSKPEAITALSRTDRPLSFVTTGHSLGGAMSTLAAYDLKTRILPSLDQKLQNRFKLSKATVQNINFASPRVTGTRGALEIEKALGKDNIVRVRNNWDFVTMVPPPITTGSRHVGVEIPFDYAPRHNLIPNILARHSMTKYKEETQNACTQIKKKHDKCKVVPESTRIAMDDLVRRQQQNWEKMTTMRDTLGTMLAKEEQGKPLVMRLAAYQLGQWHYVVSRSTTRKIWSQYGALAAHTMTKASGDQVEFTIGDHSSEMTMKRIPHTPDASMNLAPADQKEQARILAGPDTENFSKTDEQSASELVDEMDMLKSYIRMEFPSARCPSQTGPLVSAKASEKEDDDFVIMPPTVSFCAPEKSQPDLPAL